MKTQMEVFRFEAARAAVAAEETQRDLTEALGTDAAAIVEGFLRLGFDGDTAARRRPSPP